MIFMIIEAVNTHLPTRELKLNKGEPSIPWVRYREFSLVLAKLPSNRK